MSATKQYQVLVREWHRGDNDRRDKRKADPPKDKDRKLAYLNGYHGRVAVREGHYKP